MNDYIIVDERGRFVSDPHTNGTGKSYTRDIRHAKRFSTREAAEHDACGNETVMRMDEWLQ